MGVLFTESPQFGDEEEGGALYDLLPYIEYEKKHPQEKPQVDSLRVLGRLLRELHAFSLTKKPRSHE